jgi:predicted nucleic acid-binding protein
MIVVSDTTPLISLLKIKRVDLLKELFGEFHIKDLNNALNVSHAVNASLPLTA